MPRRLPSHRETEIKLSVKDLPALIEKLRKLGVKPRGRVLERNTLFDTDALDLRHRGRLLRLRIETPAPAPFAKGGSKGMILTAKSPAALPRAGRKKRRYKESMEREVRLRESSRRGAAAKRTLRDRGWPFALGVLGLRSKFRYEKYRTTFRMHGVHVDLDETPVGVFLELEGLPEAIDTVARELGFAPSDYIRATYYGLYAADQRRKGRPVHNMLFPR
jgi:adenylate cyclase class 2